MRARAGHTLIELVAVLAVLAVIAVFAVPMIGRGQAASALRGEARALHAALVRTRAEAAAEGRAVALRLDAGAGQYRIGSGPAHALPDGIEIAAGGVGAGGGGAAAFAFLPDGGATGGWIRLARGNDAWRVSIDWLTGDVRLARDDG